MGWSANNATLSPFDGNLVAYWNMDEASGNRIDSVASYVATDINTVLAVAGKNNNAADFVSAASEALDIAHAQIDLAALIATRNWSIAFWIKKDDTSNDDIMGAFKSPADGITIYTEADVLTVRVWGSGVQVGIVEWTGIGDNAWHHVVATCDLATTTMKLYVDSVLRDTDVAVGAIIDTNGGFAIGDIVPNHWSGTHFDGAIDELPFWDTELSQTEVTALYNGATGAFWTPFDETTLNRISGVLDRTASGVLVRVVT